MSVIYPSALAVLRVRLDERVPGEPLATAAVGEPGLAGAGSVLTAALGPVGIVGPGDPFSYVEGVKPSRVVVHRRSYREADEATVVFAAEYLPLDPRMVRAVAVDVYLGSVPATLFGQGMASGWSALSTVLGTPDNQVFVGYADEGTWDFGDGTIELQCRGLQALLQDTKVPGPGTKKAPSVTDQIPLEQPLHAVVWALVQSAPMARGMRVAARLPVGVPPAAIPLVAAALGPQALRVTKGGTRLAVEDGAETYWKLISRVCLLAGWVPSVELDTVVLRPAATLRPGAEPQHFVDHYWPAGLSTGLPYRRALWWGQDLEGLRLARPWAEASRKRIEVRQWSHELGQTLTAVWPPLPQASKVGATGRTADEEREVIVTSALNPAALLGYARAIYEERAARDMRGSFETREVSSQAISTAEAPVADLMRLRPGDDLEIGILPQRPETGEQGTAPAIYGRTAPELTAFLVARGFAPQVAAAFALHLVSTPLLNTFRVSEATHTFDEEEGYSLSGAFSAYLVAGFTDG